LTAVSGWVKSWEDNWDILSTFLDSLQTVKSFVKEGVLMSVVLSYTLMPEAADFCRGKFTMVRFL